MVRRFISGLAATVILVAACGGAPESSPPEATGPAPTVDATPAPASDAEQTLVMVIDGDVAGGLSTPRSASPP